MKATEGGQGGRRDCIYIGGSITCCLHFDVCSLSEHILSFCQINPEKMDVEGTKYLTMFLLGIVPLILGFLPLKVGKQFYNNDKPWKRTFTSVLLCYGGGLLLATASIHILPEVRETLEKADYVWLKDRPFGEIFTAIGFFIIYFIEEFVHYFLDSSIHHHHRYVLNFRNLIYSTNFLSTFQCLSSSSQIIHCSYQCL